MVMMDELTNDKERLHGRNVVAMAIVLDPQMKFDIILVGNHKKLKAIVLHALQEVQNES